MKTQATWLTLLAMCALVVPRHARAQAPETQPGESAAPLFTACNIWYEKPDVIWSINYKTGAIIPAGTEVRNVEVKKAGFGVRRGRLTIQFETVSDGRAFVIHFEEKFHPGVTAEDLKNQMFSSKNLDQLTKGLTAKEVDCIKRGLIEPGMSKRAVLVCYGPPATHMTPSQESTTWRYWINRFRTVDVRFDSEGRTTP